MPKSLTKIFNKMSKKSFLAEQAAKREEKKVAIAQTGINENYDAQSAEYKQFRCSVNKWQKEWRDYLNAEKGLDFTKCFRFEVLTASFKITEKGKTVTAKMDEEDLKDLHAEMEELTNDFLQNVCKK